MCSPFFQRESSYICLQLWIFWIQIFHDESSTASKCVWQQNELTHSPTPTFQRPQKTGSVICMHILLVSRAKGWLLEDLLRFLRIHFLHVHRMPCFSSNYNSLQLLSAFHIPLKPMFLGSMICEGTSIELVSRWRYEGDIKNAQKIIVA